MASETANKRRFIILPKKHMDAFSKCYVLDHGLFITELHPCINERYLYAYFKDWGNITMCKIITSSKCRIAFVRFSTAEEADDAFLASPHYIGGTDCTIKRVVSPKMDDESENEAIPAEIKKPRPRRSMGLGYILEDPQWLEDDDDEQGNKL
ncbi:heterogeneous nuclear ribonucleoprotein A0 [Cyprinodon tularosa]|uniref:heterogeneous nuclear ribonucleoprotein A0 n=1 Tax=Cyprinodon tularosa TaxID=77115 RepID=UPI0018E25738|nr:heterogeneous nuclear ribonucleoprotein A0 [Cyprinodon tularosa]